MLFPFRNGDTFSLPRWGKPIPPPNPLPPPHPPPPPPPPPPRPPPNKLTLPLLFFSPPLQTLLLEVCFSALCFLSMKQIIFRHSAKLPLCFLRSTRPGTPPTYRSQLSPPSRFFLQGWESAFLAFCCIPSHFLLARTTFPCFRFISPLSFPSSPNLYRFGMDSFGARWVGRALPPYPSCSLPPAYD